VDDERQRRPGLVFSNFKRKPEIPFELQNYPSLPVLIVRAVDGFGESKSSQDGLLPGDDGPVHCWSPGLEDGPIVEIPTQGAEEVERDGHGPGRLSKERDVIRVTAESLNVILDELKGHQLIEHPWEDRKEKNPVSVSKARFFNIIPKSP